MSPMITLAFVYSEEVTVRSHAPAGGGLFYLTILWPLCVACRLVTECASYPVALPSTLTTLPTTMSNYSDLQFLYYY